MNESLKTILDLLSRCGFLKTVDSCMFKNWSLGPLAIILAHNIRTEWMNSNVLRSDVNTFLYDSRPNTLWHEDCQHSYSHALQNNKELPFALVSVSDSSLSNTTLEGNTSSQNESLKTNVYRRLLFISEKDSQQYFFRLQRQRKIWWRKFSTDPERFSIVDKNSDESQGTVQIAATFPWTSDVVETITCHRSQPLVPYRNIFEIGSGRKKTLPHVIESVCLESPAVMTYLCDAYQQLPARTMLRLHRSLAPYKAAVLIDSSGDKLDELNQLARFLSLNLRKAGLHTLEMSSASAKASLASQLSAHDRVGVPYTVVARPSALVDGILGLRSRDTTLEEQVHVSKLTSYMQQLLSHQSK